MNIFSFRISLKNIKPFKMNLTFDVSSIFFIIIKKREVENNICWKDLFSSWFKTFDILEIAHLTEEIYEFIEIPIRNTYTIPLMNRIKSYIPYIITRDAR